MENSKTKKLVLSAMLVALGTAISILCEFIPFLRLPFGGTITLASLLPVILVGYFYGPGWGFGASFVFAALKLVVEFQTVGALFTPGSDSYAGVGIALGVLLLDYICAYTAVGVASFFRKMKHPAAALAVGSLVACLVCYAFHTLSGTLFYGAWAEWFFTETVFGGFAFSKWVLDTFTGTGLAFVYSLVYNGCYMIPETVITLLAAVGVSAIPAVRKGREG
ncbi:MAG: energy-coupled thiamine transporter ThiT [Clostridia bacterium]|nr:energy-coupled thiamine transporter ThiT [Clostridia bacterium]